MKQEKKPTKIPFWQFCVNIAFAVLLLFTVIMFAFSDEYKDALVPFCILIVGSLAVYFIYRAYIRWRYESDVWRIYEDIVLPQLNKRPQLRTSQIDMETFDDNYSPYIFYEVHVKSKGYITVAFDTQKGRTAKFYRKPFYKVRKDYLDDDLARMALKNKLGYQQMLDDADASGDVIENA